MSTSNLKLFTLLHDDIRIAICSKDHNNNFFEKLKTLLQNETLCDVELISGVDGKRLKAHRLVLCTVSEYFAAKFSGTSDEIDEKEIVLNDIPGDILAVLVKFCYTGTLELHASTVQSLMDAAYLLRMDEVINECTDFICCQLHPSNCLGIFLYGEKHNNLKLLSKAEKFICDNFAEVCANEEMLHLNYNQLVKLLSNEEIQITREEKVFDCLRDWIEFDYYERKKYFDNLLALIRLPLMKPSYLVENVQPLCVSAESKQLVIEAMMYNLMPQSCSAISLAKPFEVYKNLLVVGSQEITNKICVQIYNHDVNAWSDLKVNESGPYGRSYAFGVTAIDQSIYLVGGKHNGFITNKLRRLNLSTMSLTVFQPMNTKRIFLKACTYNGRIYAIGGSNDREICNSVECYDPHLNTWSNITPMTIRRRRLAAAVMDGCLYVAGGFNDEMGVLSSVECFNLRLEPNTWAPCSDMNTKRYDFGLAASNGFLYAVGGYVGYCSYTSTVERYDPQANKWIALCSLNIARALFGCIFINENLYAVGGNTGSCLKTVETYDADNNRWMQLAPLASGNLSCVTAVVIAYCA